MLTHSVHSKWRAKRDLFFILNSNGHCTVRLEQVANRMVSTSLFSQRVLPVSFSSVLEQDTSYYSRSPPNWDLESIWHFRGSEPRCLILPEEIVENPSCFWVVGSRRRKQLRKPLCFHEYKWELDGHHRQHGGIGYRMRRTTSTTNFREKFFSLPPLSFFLSLVARAFLL